MRSTNFTYSGELERTKYNTVNCDIPGKFKNPKREYSRFPPKVLYSFDGKHYALKPD